MIRYLILSPSEQARQAFLGGLFGAFELSPRGRGEKVYLDVEAGRLEVVGTGVEGRLYEMATKLIGGGVQVDGILFLIPSGDNPSWEESRRITDWISENAHPVVSRSWVFASLQDLDRETTRKALLTLVAEHGNSLSG